MNNAEQAVERAVKALDFLLENNTNVDFLIKQAENLTKKAKILTQNA